MSLAKKKTVLNFQIPDFVNLPQNTNEFTGTDIIISSDYEQYLKVFPRGHGNTASTQIHVTFSLQVRRHHDLDGNGNDNSEDKNDNNNGPIADAVY